MFAENKKLDPLPLILAFVEEPFKQWGINFIGPISRISSAEHMFILMTTNYFMKWFEAIRPRKKIIKSLATFL